MLSIDGVYLQEEVLTKEEESHLISSIDSFGWNDSQSGRRKQDFGPKINFKKKKINFTSFYGLPQLDMKLLERIKKERLRDDANCTKFSTISRDVLEKDTSASVLCNFKTVEVCHLEYWFALHCVDFINPKCFFITALNVVPPLTLTLTIFGSGESVW